MRISKISILFTHPWFLPEFSNAKVKVKLLCGEVLGIISYFVYSYVCIVQMVIMPGKYKQRHV